LPAWHCRICVACTFCGGTRNVWDMKEVRNALSEVQCGSVFAELRLRVRKCEYSVGSWIASWERDSRKKAHENVVLVVPSGSDLIATRPDRLQKKSTPREKRSGGASSCLVQAFESIRTRRRPGAIAPQATRSRMTAFISLKGRSEVSRSEVLYALLIRAFRHGVRTRR